MKCQFPNDKDKECDMNCKYYHTCTRSEYKKKEGQVNGGKG